MNDDTLIHFSDTFVVFLSQISYIRFSHDNIGSANVGLKIGEEIIIDKCDKKFVFSQLRLHCKLSVNKNNDEEGKVIWPSK